MSQIPEEPGLIKLLDQLGGMLTSSLNLKENIDYMLRAISRLVKFDAASVFLLDSNEIELRAIATYPYSEQVNQIALFRVGEGIVGWTVQNNKVVNIPDALQDNRFKIVDPSRAPRSMLLLPLSTPKRVLGAMSVARRNVTPFTDVETALIKVISNQAAISIENATLYTEMHSQMEEIASKNDELENANVQIQEVSRLKSEFLANMSHELRTPLNSILGFSEILKDNLGGVLTEEQRLDCLESIHASGEHLLQLINDVLDMSKIEAGKMELFLEEFIVDSTFREVITIVKSLASKKSIELDLVIEPEDLRVYADKSKVKQILYNYLSNAIKFTPEDGKIKVQAKLRPDAQDVLVEVSDTGVGIPAEHLDKVWGEFYMVQGQHQKQKGTGLGLALVRKLVELHGGQVGVKSQEGTGSVFTFTIPLQSGKVDGSQGRSSQILIVEDDPSNLELTRMILVSGGYRVESATDGQSALMLAKELHPDLILMDLQLLGIDGLSATRALKSDPDTSDIKVVALTANAMKGTKEAALQAGCIGYMTKPIDATRFARDIGEFLRQ
jgi:signal transduction histidine kinase/CheY-like chemotaxis protein